MKSTIKAIRNYFLLIPILAMSLAAVYSVAPAMAVDYNADTCNCGKDTQVYNAECGAICTDVENDTCLIGEDASGNKCLVNKIIDTALFLLGAISVVMLIFGGVRYTVSGGDSTRVANAKNTILYAIVGIVVAVLAYAIVNFVIARLV